MKPRDVAAYNSQGYFLSLFLKARVTICSCERKQAYMYLQQPTVSNTRHYMPVRPIQYASLSCLTCSRCATMKVDAPMM